MVKAREMLSLEEGIVRNMNQSGFRHLAGGSGPDGKCTRHSYSRGRFGEEIKGWVSMGKLRQLEINLQKVYSWIPT